MGNEPKGLVFQRTLCRFQFVKKLFKKFQTRPKMPNHLSSILALSENFLKTFFSTLGKLTYITKKSTYITKNLTYIIKIFDLYY